MVLAKQEEKVVVALGHSFIGLTFVEQVLKVPEGGL